MCGIYGIRNMVNGKWYIGQSVNIDDRRRHHFRSLQDGKHYNWHLQKAFTQYGKNNFEFHVLEETKEEMLDIRERAWIAYYKSTDKKFGYNMEDGGSFQKHHSKETCLRLSKLHKGTHPSKETLRKLSESHMGIPQSNETIKKRVEGRRGYRHTKETKNKMSAARMGWNPSKKTRLKMSKAKKGKIPWNLGKHPSIESRKKMSEAHKKH